MVTGDREPLGHNHPTFDTVVTSDSIRQIGGVPSSKSLELRTIPFPSPYRH